MSSSMSPPIPSARTDADPRLPAEGPLHDGPLHEAVDRRVHRIPVDDLLPADSPRIAGEDVGHARALAACGDPLPPILVHRSTLRVIDGTHRLRAARLRGQHLVEVRFFDGSPEDAFVLAVESNTLHGLPLTLADRTAAAARILASHPDWSDRAVASRTGLAAATVGALRRRTAPPDEAAATRRIGQDGRVRPLSTAEGRRAAARLIAEDPGASLRAIAERTGLSPGTVRDVRRRTDDGEDPVPPRQREAERKTAPERAPSVPAVPPAAGDGGSGRGLDALVRNLCQDPALRLSDAGRLLLRMFDAQVAGARQRQQILAAVPAHRAATAAAAADQCAALWRDLAIRMRSRSGAEGGDT
ncbi:winged helix-turn-helix transcriptional regulator [Streptomyces sp. NPDC045431]|uniref:ParB/RepB/Spo0J family partition protein n=1 Tax=Streptomyces sp. NPDC045431 TaxID=3155613 RepID=UPI0033D24E47